MSSSAAYSTKALQDVGYISVQVNNPIFSLNNVYDETSTDFSLPLDTTQRVAAAWPAHYSHINTAQGPTYDYATDSQLSSSKGAPSKAWGPQYALTPRQWNVAFNSGYEGPVSQANGAVYGNKLQLKPSNPSSSLCGKIRETLWGSGARKALTLVTTTAAVVVPVVIILLSKSSAASGEADESSHESTATALSVMNATASTLANVATTAFGVINATSALSTITNIATTALEILNATVTPSSGTLPVTSFLQTSSVSSALPTASSSTASSSSASTLPTSSSMPVVSSTQAPSSLAASSSTLSSTSSMTTSQRTTSIPRQTFRTLPDR